MRHDEKSAECLVFSFKEGLLSKVAHDLMIRVQRFELSLEDARLQASFDAGSLRVLTAMRQGREDPSALSAKDQAKIDGNIRDDVLDARRFPEVRFVAEGVERDSESLKGRGTLTLHGVSRSLAFVASRRGDRYVAELRIDQRDFGIRPFSALMGALKIQPEVRVRISVPAT